MKRKVILVTDGDVVARKTVETVAKNVGGRCISLSAGNPTPFSGEEIVSMIKNASVDPVLVMLDDKGCQGPGRGEQALAYIAHHPDIELLGVLAVASNTSFCTGAKVDCSVTMYGNLVAGPVDKDGMPEAAGHRLLDGDTVGILDHLEIPIVIGIGDIGKMHGKDHFQHGAKITTQAVEYILRRSGFIR